MENLNNIIRVDWRNQRVLTYRQVADALNCSVDQLRSLYKAHKEQFKEGVHYFNIEGAALKALKKDMLNRYVDTPTVRTFAKGAKCLKLWTYQGVACLSKLIDTDEAWRLFKALEYKYFGIETAEEKKTSVEEVAPVDISAAVIADLQQQFAALNEKIDALDEKVTRLENVFSQWLEEIQNRLTPADETVAFAEKIRNDEPIKHASPTMRAGQLKPACVYAFLMGDETVKIGNTADIDDRIKRVERLSNLNVLKKYCTSKMSRKQAQVLERKMHKKFAALRMCGEFFNVPFEEVCAELDKLAAEIAVVEEISDIGEPKVKLLVDLCAVPIDCPEKISLFKETANLILGKNIF